MTTLAIVGAGPGLGAAVARQFGREGFAVALISRSQQRADALAAELAADGVTARGFAADVRDPASLAATLEAATETLGPIEVLQYSPLPQKDFMRPLLETTPADLAGPIEFSIYGPVAFAGESAYAQMLHETLAGDGIHVAQLIIPGAIRAGHPKKDPAVLARTIWGIHSDRGELRQFADALDA